jgi:hypothetical protein
MDSTSGKNTWSISIKNLFAIFRAETPEKSEGPLQAGELLIPKGRNIDNMHHHWGRFTHRTKPVAAQCLQSPMMIFAYKIVNTFSDASQSRIFWNNLTLKGVTT